MTVKNNAISPGTTPFVAMALIDIAVSIVCENKKQNKRKLNKTQQQQRRTL